MNQYTPDTERVKAAAVEVAPITGAEFYRWLERVKREAGAAALRQAAEATRDAYPVDLFIPIDAERVKQAQKVLAGIGLTVDGFSAMAMRHWATLTDRMADAIERGE